MVDRKRLTTVTSKGLSGLTNQNNSKIAYVFCNGCPDNRMDAARAENYLAKNGYSIAKNIKEANLILFNACGLTTEGTLDSLKIIKEIESQKNRNQQLIVWGCLPNIDPDTLKAIYTGPIFPGSELEQLPNLIHSDLQVSSVVANHLGKVKHLMEKATATSIYLGSHLGRIYKTPALAWKRYVDSKFNLIREKDPSFYYIKISTGCRGNCTYCAVRKSRGTVKSKPIHDVLSEFEEGLRKGFKNFSLLGTDLGAYGEDLGYTLVDLLKEVVKINAPFKIYLRNCNPAKLRNFLKDFIPILQTKKIKYIEIPVESGNNRILKLMNRNYTIEEYKNIIKTLRKYSPDLIIRTQMLVGFPTEREEEFQDSVKLLSELIFDFVEVYEYSGRPGIPAEQIEPKVPDEIKWKRFIGLYKKTVLNRTGRKVKKILLKKV